MQLGFIGLGRMGGNMVHRIRRDSEHAVVAYDPSADARAAVEQHGATTVTSLPDLVSALKSPRSIWMMVPAGKITDETLQVLFEGLSSGDTVIDGGNAHYLDTVARAKQAASRGINYVDAGTSGGIWGLQEGYCLMVGGDQQVVERHRPIFEVLAPPNGFLHVGPTGAGNYVKMVHNGIEYGMLQAYAEGFAILEAKKDFGDFDLGAIAHLWNQGSVVRSWLLELAERALAADPKLSDLRGWVDDTGEGRWTVQESIDLAVPAPVLALSLYSRFQSRLPDGFGNKFIAALRNQFGGHAVKTEESTRAPR